MSFESFMAQINFQIRHRMGLPGADCLGDRVDWRKHHQAGTPIAELVYGLCAMLSGPQTIH